jgi:hypothetical protein
MRANSNICVPLLAFMSVALRSADAGLQCQACITTLKCMSDAKMESLCMPSLTLL